jgi:hypothetical protein
MRTRLSYIDGLNPLLHDIPGLIAAAKKDLQHAVARVEQWEFEEEKENTGSVE